MSNLSNSEVSTEAVEPCEAPEPSSLARRDMFKIAGARLATAARSGALLTASSASTRNMEDTPPTP